MDWYFAVDGQQQGPVSDEDFKNLVTSGRIMGSTLVWRSGMSDWTPWSQVAAPAGMAAPSPVAPVPGGYAPQPGGYQQPGGYSPQPGGYLPPPGSAYGAPQYGAGTPLQQTGTVFCSQCGRPHQAEEMVELFNQAVCPSCKPLFLQRMQEGTMNYNALMGVREYGGFWIRFVAKIVDGIILQIINTIIQLPFNLTMDQNNFDDIMAWAGIFTAFVLTMAVQCGYVTFFLGKYGATPGKMACKLRVIRPDGSKLTYMRAFGRYWAEVVSGFTCTIGYIIAAFDDEKRALHDHIASTRVIKVG